MKADVALEVGDIEEALVFYGKIFRFTVRGRGKGQAFIDMGDQFLALMEEKTPHADRQRHFGLVVDDREAIRQALTEMNAQILPGRFLAFIDPWGNHVEVVGYGNVLFTKSPQMFRAMGIPALPKTARVESDLVEMENACSPGSGTDPA